MNMRKTNVALASAFIVILASTTAANASKCPDITTQRSEFVKNQFDASLLVGLWYEHMYIDIAQLGASCERLNATYNDATGVVTSDFIVKYGELPLQKRIQIDQKITAKKAKVIQKITKKLLRTLKQKEGERVKMAKQSAQDMAVGD